MLKLSIASFVCTLAMVAGGLSFNDPPKSPEPAKEHTWLKQLEGEWITNCEAVMEPGKPPVKCAGTETVKMLGPFWACAELKSEMFGTPVIGHMTVGYDAAKKKYVGTWVCSMDSNLVLYQGSVSGNSITLECEMPDPKTGQMTKMKDVIEIKDKDHKVLTSYALGADGKWTTFMTLDAKRKK